MFCFKNHEENEAGRLVSDWFFQQKSFEKLLKVLKNL